MRQTHTLHHDGLTRTVSFTDHPYDVVKFTIDQTLTDAATGKELSYSGYTSFFTTKDFVEFFGPLVNKLKERLDHVTTNRVQE